MNFRTFKHWQEAIVFSASVRGSITISKDMKTFVVCY